MICLNIVIYLEKLIPFNQFLLDLLYINLSINTCMLDNVVLMTSFGCVLPAIGPPRHVRRPVGPDHLQSA